jgi:hypothetical protein
VATATKKTPAKRAPTKPAAAKRPPAKRPQKGTLDYLELALENLRAASETAPHEAREQLRAAIDRLRGTIADVRDEVRRRAYGG